MDKYIMLIWRMQTSIVGFYGSIGVKFIEAFIIFNAYYPYRFIL